MEQRLARDRRLAMELLVEQTYRFPDKPPKNVAGVEPVDNALTFCKRLRALPHGRDVRLILRHPEQNAPRRLDWLAAGADEGITGPLDEQLFLARVRALLRQQAAEAELSLEFEQPQAGGFCEPASPFHRPARIALVSGDCEVALRRLQAKLGTRLDDHLEVLTPEAALTAANGAADVYVITEDPGRPAIAEALLSQLHANRATRHSSLIYIAGPARSSSAARALDLGACEVNSGEPELDELAVRLRRQVARKRRRDRLRAGMRDSLRAAITDSLTDLNNRRFALSHLARRIGGGGRSPYALFLVDLDGFKQVNDTYGHAAGDALLGEVADRFRRRLCDADLQRSASQSTTAWRRSSGVCSPAGSAYSSQAMGCSSVSPTSRYTQGLSNSSSV